MDLMYGRIFWSETDLRINVLSKIIGWNGSDKKSEETIFEESA